MRRRRRLFAALTAFLMLLLGFAVGNAVALKLTVTEWDFVGRGVFAVDSPLPVPSLHDIVSGAQTDEAAYAAAVDYFEAHERELATVFGEQHPDRLRALYAMYVIHMSHPYDSLPDVNTFLDYLAAPVSDCSDYATWQVELSRRLGLEARRIEIWATHTWAEVKIDEQWEIFDGTTNVWIDRSGFDLERGAVRHYRTFYTPLLETDTPVALSGQRLRIQMQGLGIFWTPIAHLLEVELQPSNAE